MLSFGDKLSDSWQTRPIPRAIQFVATKYYLKKSPKSRIKVADPHSPEHENGSFPGFGEGEEIPVRQEIFLLNSSTFFCGKGKSL